ncbi:hypothetical protein BDV97DRAFT_373658 [Delphinella strobiligena]|nr:hypothetical protein BDV97DRAFT_373658 [Delphinella strobiligena]
MHRYSESSSLRSRDSGLSGHKSDHSSNSNHSYNTGATINSTSVRPVFSHHDTCQGRLECHYETRSTEFESRHPVFDDPRLSVETYASTVDFADEDEEVPERHLPHVRPVQIYQFDALPATPADFGELFPSSRQLSIKHDDSTDDGNMNLRLDTTVNLPGNKSQEITLFHLRLHDLKKREFSLRRYCRDSGREVCNSVRKYQESSMAKRPGLGRSINNAFAAMRSISDSKAVTNSNLKRSDSGYGSISSHKSIEAAQESMPTGDPSSRGRHAPIPTNTTKLEFSNYSHVEVKRRGARSNKRYEFEYWGTDYAWKRVVDKSGPSLKVMYHLYRADDLRILAHIEPRSLSSAQALEERRKGGWIPPSTMWIDDKQILEAQNETSDVVVASGIIALVDDCIKQRFHPKPTHQFVIPVPKLKIDMDYIGTKALLKEMLQKSNKRETTPSRRPTPSRHNTHDL